MLKPELTEQNTNYILRLLVFLLEKDVVGQLSKLWRMIRKGFWFKSYEGMYEVLEYRYVLHLLDTKGKRAKFQKFQRVKFNQNNIIAFQDQAWGEGDIFADYKASPGVAVDRYKQGHRYLILISLREVKDRGDITDFYIERTIENGFTETVEFFQTEINHVMHSLSCTIIFPKERPPKQVKIIKQNLQQVYKLGPECFTILPDGQIQVTWTTPKPLLFEAYILQWVW